MPMVRWVARHALPNGLLKNNGHKNTDTQHPLPDFYLQNTCKFAVQYPRPGSPRWPWEPCRKTAESSCTFFLRYPGTHPVMSTWRSTERYRLGGRFVV